MAKKPAGIEKGDWLALQVKVTGVWDNGMVTVELAGQHVTMRESNSSIVGVTKKREPKERHGKPGTSPLAKLMGDSDKP